MALAHMEQTPGGSKDNKVRLPPCWLALPKAGKVTWSTLPVPVLVSLADPFGLEHVEAKLPSLPGYCTHPSRFPPPAGPKAAVH